MICVKDNASIEHNVRVQQSFPWKPALQSQPVSVQLLGTTLS